MKIYRIIYALLVAVLMVSCFDDETTIADLSTLSEITIDEASVQKQYDINKNESLTISPIVKQSNKQKALRYTWEVNLEVYSRDKELLFKGDKLGSYNCRLIVENEDGKTFLPFKINVNSPYEEGITVLSADVDGRPVLSFMQTPANPNEWGTFTTDELLTLNNEGMDFVKNPSDMHKANTTLFITCQGGGDTNDAPTIYYLNEKTFVVENLLAVPEYPDFKPTKILMPTKYNSQTAWLPYQILSADGKMYNFSARECALEPSPKFAFTYSQATHYDDGWAEGYYSMVLWDKEKNALLNAYNGGNGPFYFGSKRHMYRNDEEFESINYFNGAKLVTIVSIRATKEQAKKDGYELIVIAKLPNGDINRLVVESSFWDGGPPPNPYYTKITTPYDMADFSTNINENTPCIASKTYESMLYADGNKVRRWYYTTTQFISEGKTLLTVGSSGKAVITGFEMSADQRVTYVSYYEPDAEGKNGSVVAFNTDTGEILKEWPNVCYKPVKMFYKYK